MLLVVAHRRRLAGDQVGASLMDKYQFLIAPRACSRSRPGLLGVVVRRNLLVVLMCMEVMLNSVVLAFVDVRARTADARRAPRCCSS